jgi:hypothetical protein
MASGALTECGSCRFWFGGQCKRYPPSLVPWPNDNQHPIMYTPVESHPMTKATDWCGEYQLIALERTP